MCKTAVVFMCNKSLRLLLIDNFTSLYQRSVNNCTTFGNSNVYCDFLINLEACDPRVFNKQTVIAGSVFFNGAKYKDSVFEKGLSSVTG